jgi:iron(III) transport system permease protein
MTELPVPQQSSLDHSAASGAKYEARMQLSYRSLLALWLPSVLVGAAVLLPVVYLLLRASQAESGLMLLLRPSTLATLGRTLGLSLAVTLSAITVALPLAFLTTRTDLPLRRFWLVSTVLPIVLPSYVGAYLLVSTIGPRGMVQNWLEPLGIVRLPDIYGFPGALFILTLVCYPYVLLGVRAGLQNIDASQEEAARSLGLTRWQTFWKVILPQLRPAIASSGMLVAFYVLRDFGAVSVMRFDTFTRVIYIQYRSTFDRSTAAVLALMLVALTFGMLSLEQRTRGKARFHAGTAANKQPAPLVKLGWWRWPALGFVVLVVIAGVVLPAVNLLYWLVRGLMSGEVIRDMWLAARNSVIASGLAAAITLLAALPLAVLSVRFRTSLSGFLERVSYLAFSMPGIVVALALVFFSSRYALPLYQTLPLLVYGYMILNLPEALGALRTSLLQVHPYLEQAGRSLGHNPFQVFRKITLPLVRPGILTGVSLVFLTTMKELPTTLILSPIGFKTLATSVWGAVSEAFFAQAAAPALLIILVSSLPTALLLFREEYYAD